MPRLSQPRVVWTVAISSPGATRSGDVRAGAEHLAELEGVVAGAAVEHGDRAVVVGVEVVVARPPLTCEDVDGSVVVDALVRRRVRRRSTSCRLQAGDEVLRGAGRRSPSGMPLIVSDVDAVAGCARVVDVHDVVGRAGRVDDVVVAAALAVEIDGVARAERRAGVERAPGPCRPLSLWARSSVGIRSTVSRSTPPPPSICTSRRRGPDAA